jgi:alkylation response protein AidB-like acyl-CoA dehydrogenase
MPVAVTEEQRAIRSAVRDWARRHDTIATVRALEDAPDTERSRPPGEASRAGLFGAKHWAGLADLGLFAIALPPEVGGAGGAVADLAAALEQVTDALVPGPVLPTLLAGLVLRDRPDLPVVKDLATGRASVAVGLTAGGPVLGAGTTTHLLLPDGADWALLDANQVTIERRPPVDFSRSLGNVHRSTKGEPVTGRPVRDLAATLAAAEAAGVAGWCVRTATDYAKVRQQFGRPIGAFQAVKHLAAGMLCRYERAAAVAWDAARAVDEAPDEHPLAAAVAAAVALDAAVDNAKDCVQILGGIGFTWEHDAHLYLRRALALRQLLGGSAAWRVRAAELAKTGARRRLSVTVGADPTVQSRVREIAALPADRQRAALADAGYLAPQWPAPYGLAASAAEQLVIDEELSRAGLTRPELAIGAWAVPTILGFGTAAQQDRFAGPTLRGELTWCQLFSEPEAGSDLASLRTKAVRVDGGWELSGQKVWTSLAREADWAICLARTDQAAPKHRGLTYFLVAMDSPGIDIRPLREITGRSVFNEVFLDGVFVPDDCVVGAPGDGWRLARATLATERVAMGRGSSLGENVEALLSTDADEELGGLVADGLAVSLLDLRAMLAQLDGQDSGALSAVRKLVGVAHRQAVAEAAYVRCGPDGAAADAEPLHEFLLTRCLSIAGGTTQILLSLVAERVLGLPREEVR